MKLIGRVTDYVNISANPADFAGRLPILEAVYRPLILHAYPTDFQF